MIKNLITRSSILVVFLFCNLLAGFTFAQAREDRVAFILGNAAYPSAVSLKNPINDAVAVDKQLRQLGFETNSFKDLSTKDTLPLRRLMESRIKRQSVVVFYYAGHGMQIDGRNYLLPIDANLTDSQRAAEESVYLGDVLHAIEKTRPKLAIVILDACRDNPFKATKEVTTLKQGLARVDPPTSTVVFYATRPGGTALDGEGDNGVFTQALLKELSTPSLPLEVILRRVSSSVFKQTKSDQEPWIEGVIREEFVINSGLQTLQPTVADAIEISPSITAATSSLLVETGKTEVHATTQIALHDAIDRLRSIQTSELETSPTYFACDSSQCEDYKSWIKRFSTNETQKKIQAIRELILKSKLARMCELDLKSKECLTQDVRFPFYGLNLVLSNKVYGDGFALQNTSISKSGGLTFSSTFLGGAILYVGHKTKSNCQPAESKIEFERDRLSFEIARVTCLNNFTVSFNKTTLNVLLFNHDKNELIAEINLNFFGAGLGAVVGGGKKLVKINFS